MGNTEYFQKYGYKPTWSIGDRVFGKYESVPFVGTVGCDHLVSEVEGPKVSVFLDLPIQKKNIIFVKPKSLKRLITYDL